MKFAACGVLGLPLLAGCGAAKESSHPAASPANDARSPPAGGTSAEPATVEEAERAIADAKDRLSGNRSAADVAKGPSEPMSGSAARECQTPCNAIASMKRAVGALCRLTGDDDTRCRDARQTLKDSEARASACVCR